MSTTEIETKLKQLKPELQERFNVSTIGYFGSYATGEAHQDSDLDLLVDFSKPIGWDFFTLQELLEQKLGLKIDLVTPEALKEIIKDQILRQVKYV